MTSKMYNERDRDMQRRMMDAKMERVSVELDRARTAAAGGRVAEVERIVRNVRALLNDQLIPLDFSRKTQDTAKKIELDSYVMAVDMALEQGREAALARREADRTRALKLAREHLAKAMTLGAKTDFRDAVNKKIDVIMLTGGHKSDTVGAAKPISTGPKIRDLAKGEKRNYKRYETPRLTVLIGEHEFQTVDWSIGGLLIGGFAVKIPVGMDIPLTYFVGSGTRYNATAKVVRQDVEKGVIAVRFIKSTMDALEFLRGLIKQQPGGRP